MLPAFGRDTFRRIYSSPSELKRLTAHDYENLLQVSGVSGGPIQHRSLTFVIVSLILQIPVRNPRLRRSNTRSTT